MKKHHSPPMEELSRLLSKLVGVVYVGYFLLFLIGWSTRGSILYFAIPYTVHFVSLALHAAVSYFNSNVPRVYPLRSRSGNFCLAALDVVLYTALVFTWVKWQGERDAVGPCTLAYNVFFGVGIVGALGCFAKVVSLSLS